MLKEIVLAAALVAPNATEAPTEEPIIIEETVIEETVIEETAPAATETETPEEIKTEEPEETEETEAEEPEIEAEAEEPEIEAEAEEPEIEAEAEEPEIEAEAEEPEFYETPDGLTDTAPVVDDTYATPEEEYLATAAESEEEICSCPEEEFPTVEPEYATPEEEYLATGGEETNEPTPAEIHLEWVEICNSYERYELPEPVIYYQPETPKAPKTTHSIELDTTESNPYLNRKPYIGITTIVCEF